MFDIKYFDEVTSTSDIIKDFAKDGAPEWTVAVANSQTKGRGRMGRSFFSPCGTGLYMSILLRPKISADKSLLITTSAAVAAALAIEKHSGKKTHIKWVNDVYINEKKVCGILTEGQISIGGSLEYAVVGIGINLEKPKDGFGELCNIADAVFDGCTYDKKTFIKDLLDTFSRYYEMLESKPHFDEYINRDMLIGKEVDVIKAGEKLYSATVRTIDKNFALIIEHDGVTEPLTSGEVSVKIK